jgi:shikimate kinase
MLIFITGFMGSGKSHLFSTWRKETQGTFIDFDHEIAQRVNVEPGQLGHWIELEGWKAFRSIERELLQETLLLSEGVFSLGGGTLHGNDDLCPEMDLVGTRVWMDTPVGVCWERVGGDENRPLVKLGREAFDKLYQERLPLYSSANISISGTKDLPTFREFCKKYRDFLKID